MELKIKVAKARSYVLGTNQILFLALRKMLNRSLLGLKFTANQSPFSSLGKAPFPVRMQKQLY